ncbi:MAG: efflux RND transporter permease subunit, partial [bacterium]|nr:efflux RND transporter permease subunit [bacterium]
FALMHFAGLSLNLISLGGLALGVGMLVDNAIVVLENIHRHYGQGKDPVAGAVAGASEVGTAVTASTLTTVAVFLPILFIQGLAAILFRQIAITVSFALVASLAVALTFIPMASAQLAGRRRTPGAVGRAVQGRLDRLQEAYVRALRWALGRRAPVLLAALAFILAGLAVFRLLGSEFLPAVDRGEVTVAITLPRGSTLEVTDQVVRQVEDRVAAIPDLEAMFATTGGSGALAGLGRGGSRDRGAVDFRLSPGGPATADVVADLRQEVAAIPGAHIEVSLLSTMAGEDFLFGSPITVRVLGSDLETLATLAQEVAGRVARVPGTTNVATSVGEGVPELRVAVDRARASFYGLSTAAISTTVRAAIEGEVATRYRVDGSEVDVRVMLDEDSRRTPADLRRLTVLSPLGVPVRLEEVASIGETPGPPVIQREDQSRLVTISADVSGRDVGRVGEDVRRALAGLRLPPGYALEFGGETREMAEAFGTLRWALVLAVILVFMVLASLFESFLQPLVIMVTVPLAFVGAALALALRGHNLNVPALIGVIALAGIVVNNAIVFLDYLYQLRAAGLDRTEALVQAGRTRLRPILMTTTTTVLALAPLAVGWGAGVELQAPLATAMIGGLLLSTVLTLFLVPVFYTGLEDLVGLARRRRPGAPPR